MHDVRVVTVTLNPAIDHLLEAPQFTVGAHVRATRIGRNPAGKGINVARVIATLGSRVIATGFVGSGELDMFESFLDERGGGRVTSQLLRVRGRTRDNVTIMDPVLDTETHIREQGFSVVREDINRMVSKVSMLAREGTAIVFGGSLPLGMTIGDFRSLVHTAQDGGARVIVDVSGETLEVMREEPLWMLKINDRELEGFVGKKIDGEEALIETAIELSTRAGGKYAHVVITRGAAGAIAVTPGEVVVGRVFVHPGLIAHTVGCGDAMLAGIMHGTLLGENWDESLRFGLAAATAAAVSREPGVISLEDVSQYYEAADMQVTARDA